MCIYVWKTCNNEGSEHHLAVTKQDFDTQQRTDSLLGSIVVKSGKVGIGKEVLT